MEARIPDRLRTAAHSCAKDGQYGFGPNGGCGGVADVDHRLKSRWRSHAAQFDGEHASRIGVEGAGGSAETKSLNQNLAAPGLRALLSGQLREVRQLLAVQHRQVLIFAEQERQDTVLQTGRELVDLRQENQRLRTLLSVAGAGMLMGNGMSDASGGTGETSSDMLMKPPPVVSRSRATCHGDSISSREEPHIPEPPPPTGAAEPPPGSPSWELPGVVGAYGPEAQSRSSISVNRASRRSTGGLSNDPATRLMDWEERRSFHEHRHGIFDPEGDPETPPSERKGMGSVAAHLYGVRRAGRPWGLRRSFRNGAIEEIIPDVRGYHIQNGCDPNWDDAVLAFSMPSYPGPAPTAGSTSSSRISVKRNGVFADAENIKERVRMAITEEEYNVMDRYKDEGWGQQIARSATFEYITLLVISLNAIYMSIDTDWNNQPVLMESAWYFQVAEHGFCAYFVLEVVVRFVAFKNKWDATKDHWFMFDFTLVLLMVTETWIMTIIIACTSQTNNDASLGDAAIMRMLRLVRLARMGRVLRLLRACPELVILIKGMTMAGRSVFFTLCLLVSIIYVFAIGFTLLCRQTAVGARFFNSVPDSMNTLLLHGCLGEDLPDVVNMLGSESFLLGGLMLVFVLLASITVMNMLMGVLVEVVSVVAAVEKETLVVSFIKTKMASVISDLEPGFKQRISKPLFAALLQHPEALKALKEVGVDVVGLVDFSDFIFTSGDNVSFADFMELVLQLRGTNKATVRDVVDLRKCLVQELARMEQTLRIIMPQGFPFPGSPQDGSMPQAVPEMPMTPMGSVGVVGPMGGMGPVGGTGLMAGMGMGRSMNPRGGMSSLPLEAIALHAREEEV